MMIAKRQSNGARRTGKAQKTAPATADAVNSFSIKFRTANSYEFAFFLIFMLIKIKKI